MNTMNSINAGLKSSATQKAAAHARYMAVHPYGASALRNAVTRYRWEYPVARPQWCATALLVDFPGYALPQPQRPSGGPEKRVCVYSAKDGRINRVTLKREPFDVPSDRPAREVRA